MYVSKTKVSATRTFITKEQKRTQHTQGKGSMHVRHTAITWCGPLSGDPEHPVIVPERSAVHVRNHSDSGACGHALHDATSRSTTTPGTKSRRCWMRTYVEIYRG